MTDVSQVGDGPLGSLSLVLLEFFNDILIKFQFGSFELFFFYQISISDEDRNMVYKVCGLNTDPRMITFDRLSWTAYLPGEFILYRDKRRKISVSTKHTSPVLRFFKLTRRLFPLFW